jgi:hypothetical protein
VDILPREITLGKVVLVMLAVGVVRSGPCHRLILKLREILITEPGVYEVRSLFSYYLVELTFFRMLF